MNEVAQPYNLIIVELRARIVFDCCPLHIIPPTLTVICVRGTQTTSRANHRCTYGSTVATSLWTKLNVFTFCIECSGTCWWLEGPLRLITEAHLAQYVHNFGSLLFRFHCMTMWEGTSPAANQVDQRCPYDLIQLSCHTFVTDTNPKELCCTCQSCHTTSVSPIWKQLPSGGAHLQNRKAY